VANRPIVFNDPSGHIATDSECGYQGQDCKGQKSKIIIPLTQADGNPPQDPQDDELPIDPTLPTKPGAPINLKAIPSNCFATGVCVNDLDAWTYDLDPSHGDYSVFTLNAGFWLGVSISLTKDRYDNKYFGIGPSVGKTYSLITLSIMQGRVGGNTVETMATEEEMKNFLIGESANISIGILASLGINTVSKDKSAIEYGTVLPGSLGIAFMNSWLIH
jgi:hypothetical protein